MNDFSTRLRQGLLLPALGALTLLAGCGSSSAPAATATPPGSTPAAGEQVAGKVYPVTLDSNLDGEAIAFTVMEPTELVGGQTYPLIIHSHGYGGRRQTAPSAFAQRLRDAGYAVLSLDERGFGESGGQVMALDPDVEGQDWIQTLDWAEANIPWLRRRPGPQGEPNLVLGAYGLSYGGGFQHLVLAVDPKRRLDAMVPEITWHELFYSFYHNEVFKTAWLSVLNAAGTAGSGGRQADFINQTYAIGLATNDVPEEYHAPFKRNGMSNYCASRMALRADVMYWQGLRDQLFNFNEAYWNYQCMQALGGDVRLLTHQSGHLIPGVQADGPRTCGTIDQDDATFAWFEEKLNDRPGLTAGIPEICYSLDSASAVNAGSVLVGSSGRSALNIPETLLAVGPSARGRGPIAIDLGTLTEPALLAGIPKIALTIDSPLPLAQGDPRVFVSVGIQRAGTTQWQVVGEQVYAFRYFGTDLDFLPGIAIQLAAGDHFGLLLYGHHDSYALNGSRADGAVLVSGEIEFPFVTGGP